MHTITQHSFRPPAPEPDATPSLRGLKPRLRHGGRRDRRCAAGAGGMVGRLKDLRGHGDPQARAPPRRSCEAHTHTHPYTSIRHLLNVLNTHTVEVRFVCLFLLPRFKLLFQQLHAGSVGSTHACQRVEVTVLFGPNGLGKDYKENGRS